MSETVVIPLPERLLAVYAVATDGVPGELAEDTTSSGGVSIEVVPADEAPLPPAGLLRLMGAGAEALGRLGSATHTVLVQGVGAPGFPPGHEINAYAAAQLVADLHGGVLVDTAIPRIITSPRDIEDIRLSDWVVLPHSAGADGTLWFSTRGMRRFGLPELQSHGIPEAAANAWAAVLTGLAYTLVTRLGEATAQQRGLPFLEVPAEQPISLRDIAGGYSDRSRAGADPGLDAQVVLRLSWDPATSQGSESLLSVTPVSPSTPAEVVRRLFGGSGE